MKKNFVYAILSAIALSGTAGFAGCSSSDEIIDNPNYNPETNSVKTQFTISLPQNVAKTRQSADVVQAVPGTNPFRGFDNMVLIPYASVSGGDVSGKRLTSTSITLTPGSGSANTLPADRLNTNSNSYVYSDVTIPLGTSGFLFYGKAIDDAGGNFVNGVLTATPVDGTTGALLTGEKDGFGFALNAIKSGDGVATALLAYINSIAAAAPASTSTAKAWYTSVANGGNAGLLALYEKFIKMKAGSSTSVQAALEDLYESLMNNTDDASKAVIDAIKVHASYSSGLTLDASVAGYPADINLPDGAVGLTWTTATPAEASWAAANSAWSTGSSSTALANYVYPASLYYRANSPILVSNSKQSDKYLTNSWATIIDETNGLYKNGSSVGPSTQSIALVEQIDYAVAQLKSTITFDYTTATGKLKDRNGDDVQIGNSATTGANFKVTGILIGGQKNVDWQFLPTGTNIYTIYDKEIPSPNVLYVDDSGTTPQATTVTNYTLALENGTEDVYIAIEFENNAYDFMGVDGLVAKGTKFYLVGKLVPGESTANPNSLTQVFKQDYVTTANFKISANTTGTHSDPNDANSPLIYTSGLGAAYNVVPDLRTPKMELGLSVNLTWQAGKTFDIDL